MVYSLQGQPCVIHTWAPWVEVSRKVLYKYALPYLYLTQNTKTNDPKVFKLGASMTFGYPTCNMVFGLKGQRSRSQGHKLPKHTEGDRVAGVVMYFIECPTSSSIQHSSRTWWYHRRSSITFIRRDQILATLLPNNVHQHYPTTSDPSVTISSSFLMYDSNVIVVCYATELDCLHGLKGFVLVFQLSHSFGTCVRLYWLRMHYLSVFNHT